MKFRTSLAVPVLAVAVSLSLRSTLQPPKDPPAQSGRSMVEYLVVPDDVQRILKRSCYDCHSYQSRWPWYARVPGVRGMLQNDVRRARHRLNFSDWPAKLAEGPEEARASINGICEELRTESMPIGSYRWVHRDAALSPSEVQAVCHWTETVKFP